MPRCTQHKEKGFTIQEMLLVVVIIVVFLSISVVGIVTYMHHLQLTEQDNAAKEIFLSAQNRAVLLHGGQRLERYVVRPDGKNQMDHVDVIPDSNETTQITAYYIHSKDPDIQQLLPRDTIDPTLWEGDFYITYEPKSGSVVDVFFSNQQLPTEGDFPAFHKKWRSASKNARMHSRPMIGYYGGRSAESSTTISLRTPVINIYNENTLRAEITYWVPRTLSMIGEADNVKLNVSLDYRGHKLNLKQADADKREEPDIFYFAHTYTWILDSLDGKQFKSLFSAPGTALTYGNDFTINAEVSYTGQLLQVNDAHSSRQDNSLFDKGSGGETAYITCLRHLQNLDTDFSGVDGKSRAEQRGDVFGVENYAFRPVRNTQMQDYEGSNFAIYDLHIVGKDQGSTGLFGVLSGTADAPKGLHNIRLVNTAVSAQNGFTGTLVGEGDHLRLTNCQTYWENRSGQTNDLRDVLGESGSGLHYQVTSSGAAGGLAGRLDHTTLENCSASTLVQGKGVVGGLVGQGSDLTLSSSYASTYLSGGSTAGMVGNLTGNAKISSSYAVGFMDNGHTPAQAAGLCLGTGKAEVTGAYSAMLFTAGKHMTNYPLCQNGTYDHTYYLDSNLFKFVQGNETLARSYSVLCDPTEWDALFGEKVFTAKDTAQSHPYNLQTTLTLTTFIYPGLETLDHWGDWGAQFQNGSLVYYERYVDGTYGFSGGNIKSLADQVVTEDGYAVAYRSTGSVSGIGADLKVTYQTADGTQTVQAAYGNGGSGSIYEVTSAPDTAGKTSSYYLLPLPAEVVNSAYASKDFYQKITINAVGEQKAQSYYYSPHFAGTVLPYQNGMDLNRLASRMQVEVRSPRHLYMLSRFPVYYTSNHQYRFLQQLNLDYKRYTGYDLFTGNWTQAPIGLDAATPFRGSYYGNYNTITGVNTATKDDTGKHYQYVALFGYSTSVLKDIVYRMDESTALAASQSGSSSKILYIGGLVGYNGGTVRNCAVSGVRIQASCYSYSKVYLGGLAGLNEGTIHSSAAEVADVSADANLAHAYVGGFIGRNAAGGSVQQCYAVGKVSASRARYGTVYACGFAGQNEAILSRSYAAVHLTAEGGAESHGFCPDVSKNCVYLNEGNFTYRGESYSAQYEDVSAAPVTWAQLTGEQDSKAVSDLGMLKSTDAFDSDNPYRYPGIVKGKNNTPVHYGQWPDQMDLGVMGVCYWEKMNIGKIPSYHFTALSLVNGEVSKNNTLSTVHGDGGVVTEYGYGYFYRKGDTVPRLHSSGIYWERSPFDPQNKPTRQESNAAADKALSDLTGGQYIFAAYDTWQEDEQKGLHLVTRNAQSTVPPVGTWTLEQGTSTLQVDLNPFFADAMAKHGESLPGTKERPYGVRSIEQLQFINWNVKQKNTRTVLKQENQTEFPSLSYGINRRLTQRAFYWEQTHDLTGAKGKTYTPIAEFYDPTGLNQGGLFGWFGGTYDGKDYVIADVNIQGQKSSCVGLFGAVFNGTLKNIVLHSTDGKAYVRGSDSGDSRWYAIGGLVGLAGSTQGSAMDNCTVTGYTVQDTHRSTEKGGWGGTGLGGLVGVTNMDLKGCTAVTDIVLNSRDNDNVRVGGLAGSCQGSIGNCYSGGSINVEKTSSVFPNRGIYIGGIVGGIYTKILRVGDRDDITVGRSGQNLQNTLENCYSYVRLPRGNSNQHIKALYAVGGSGELNRDRAHDRPDYPNRDHGWTNYHNNYYLATVNNNGIINIDRTDIREKEVTGLTYAQMADSESADGLLHRLNARGGGFATVTTQTSGGDSIAGRYSFGSDPSLLGKNYPFPTILTQVSRVAPGGVANVHYGDWPQAGIRREYGALPVRLDLFADYQEDKGALWTESLTLAGVKRGGEWHVTSEDQDIASATLQEDTRDDSKRILHITAQKAGSTIIMVSYQVDGNTYELPIEVNVTAELRLAAKAGSSVAAFTNETISVPLELRDKNDHVLSDRLKDKIQLSGFEVEFDHTYFTKTEIRQKEKSLTLSADSTMTAGNTQMTAGYDFTYLGKNYHRTSVLTFQVEQSEIKLTPLKFVFQDGTQTEQTRSYTGTNTGDFSIAVNGSELTVSNLHITAFEEVAAEFRNIVLAGWAKDNGGNDQIGTLSITAYPPQKLNTAMALVKIQFQFDYEGSIHTLWKELLIQVEKPVPVPPAPTPPDSGEPKPEITAPETPPAEEAKPGTPAPEESAPGGAVPENPEEGQ